MFNKITKKTEMKKFMKWFGVIVSALLMCFGSGTFAMAEGAIQNPVGPVDGPGAGVQGGQTQTESQAVMEQQGNYEFYLKEVNKRIVEMKLESCPIDQILRAQERVNHSDSIVIKYYAIGQRPIASTLSQGVEASTTGDLVTLRPTNKAAFDTMDVIMFPEILGWEADGTTRSTLIPLQVRVMSSDDNKNPRVAAINGQKDAAGTRFGIPEIPQGSKMLRLGRAASEMDVETGSYYVLPEASEKYCQRFIMMCEQSIIERMSAKEIPWTFSRQERIAMDDMRGGIERQGLFGFNNKMIYGKGGAIYTTGGIFWDAGKDLELGHWVKKLDEAGNPVTIKTADSEESKAVYEYIISEKELTAFVAAAIKDAGNASRTKMLFVDNLIYQAFTNLRSKRRIITQTESNYRGWGLDFESFESMGTKILIYRHDGFNYYGMDGHAFMLDARYLEKWVFGDWQRKEYKLKDLFVRNSDAVVMEEFSCWTLSYPMAHARVTRPEFDSTLGVTDELQAA